MPESVTPILWAAAGIVGGLAMVIVGFWLYAVAFTQPIRADRLPEDDAWGM